MRTRRNRDLWQLLENVASRGDDVLFRQGRDGNWVQIGARQFLSDLRRACAIVGKSEVRVGGFGYAAFVQAFAAHLLGCSVVFEPDGDGAPAFPGPCEASFMPHEIFAQIEGLPQRGEDATLVFGNELIPVDNLVEAARQFLAIPDLSLRPPRGRQLRFSLLVGWELPLAYSFAFAALMGRAVLGFPDPSVSWDTNLRVLRPHVVLANHGEVESILGEAHSLVGANRIWRLRFALARLLRRLGLLQGHGMRQVFEALRVVVLESESGLPSDEGELREHGIEVVRINPDGYHIPWRAGGRD